MTLEEAIQKREKLLAEEREIRHAVKILHSDTFPKWNGYIGKAIDTYEDRLSRIPYEIEQLAKQVEKKPEPKNTMFNTGFKDEDIALVLKLFEVLVNG